MSTHVSWVAIDKKYDNLMYDLVNMKTNDIKFLLSSYRTGDAKDVDMFTYGVVMLYLHERISCEYDGG